jgi:hypothetical protein
VHARLLGDCSSVSAVSSALWPDTAWVQHRVATHHVVALSCVCCPPLPPLISKSQQQQRVPPPPAAGTRHPCCVLGTAQVDQPPAAHVKQHQKKTTLSTTRSPRGLRGAVWAGRTAGAPGQFPEGRSHCRRCRRSSPCHQIPRTSQHSSHPPHKPVWQVAAAAGTAKRVLRNDRCSRSQGRKAQGV